MVALGHMRSGVELSSQDIMLLGKKFCVLEDFMFWTLGWGICNLYLVLKYEVLEMVDVMVNLDCQLVGIWHHHWKQTSSPVCDEGSWRDWGRKTHSKCGSTSHGLASEWMERKKHQGIHIYLCLLPDCGWKQCDQTPQHPHCCAFFMTIDYIPHLWSETDLSFLKLLVRYLITARAKWLL